jgi:hypothetical protein
LLGQKTRLCLAKDFEKRFDADLSNKKNNRGQREKGRGIVDNQRSKDKGQSKRRNY